MLALAYIVLSLLIIQNDAARILAVFPLPSISHQVVFRPITQELARRGHEVVVVTTDSAFPNGKTPVNLTEIDIHDLAYSNWKTLYQMTTGDENKIYQVVVAAGNIITKIFEDMLKMNEVKRIMYEDNKFDLILAESCLKLVLGLSHLVKAPIIQISSLGAANENYQTIGAQLHTFLYPYILRRKINNITLWEKATEIYNLIQIYNLEESQEELRDAMLKRNLGPDIPSLQEFTNNVNMLILNNYPVWDSNRPVPSSVVFMGGIHQKSENELPKDLKIFMESSRNGVVYVSFGTNTSPSMLPKEKIQILLSVFSRLPFNVLFKWDEDELPGLPQNVKISKFFPQNDILRHPNIKAFVTQGGLQSTDEAITAEVPLVCIPMITDQWYNAEKYVHLGIGIKVDIASLTETELEASILKVIDDKSFKENISKLNKLLHDQPQSPLDRAIWWIEHVLRHGGGSHLRSPAANISWVQYYELELVGISVFVLGTLGTIVVISLSKVIRWFGSQAKPDRKKK